MTLTAYSIDAAHSSVGFSVRHMVFAKAHGRFTKFEGEIALDEQNLSASSVKVTIDTTSIDTSNEQRDGHLKSPDFFDVATHPTMTFTSTKVDGTGESFKLTGDLTIHGVTREVTLDAEITGHGKDPWGNFRTGFHAKGQINRTDFGLVWNQVLETGGVIVGEKVEISLDVEAVKKA